MLHSLTIPLSSPTKNVSSRQGILSTFFYFQMLFLHYARKSLTTLKKIINKVFESGNCLFLLLLLFLLWGGSNFFTLRVLRLQPDGEIWAVFSFEYLSLNEEKNNVVTEIETAWIFFAFPKHLTKQPFAPLLFLQVGVWQCEKWKETKMGGVEVKRGEYLHWERKIYAKAAAVWESHNIANPACALNPWQHDLTLFPTDSSLKQILCKLKWTS